MLGAALPDPSEGNLPELTAMHTNLTCAPVKRHTMSRTKFLLVIKKIPQRDGSFLTSATLRPVDDLVLVGQQQPVSQQTNVNRVPRPNSKSFTELQKRRMNHSIYHRPFPPGMPAGVVDPNRSVPLSRIMGAWPKSEQPKVRSG